MAKAAALRKPKKKVNPLDKEGITYIDYKDTALLRKFISDRGKIRARRVTGVTSQQQRQIARAVKTPARWRSCRTRRRPAERGDGHEDHPDPGGVRPRAPGDIVEVKDGYGRNYLLPQGFAINWTKAPRSRSRSSAGPARRARSVVSSTRTR